jgi:hypothetical protein
MWKWLEKLLGVAHFMEISGLSEPQAPEVPEQDWDDREQALKEFPHQDYEQIAVRSPADARKKESDKAFMRREPIAAETRWFGPEDGMLFVEKSYVPEPVKPMKALPGPSKTPHDPLGPFCKVMDAAVDDHIRRGQEWVDGWKRNLDPRKDYDEADKRQMVREMSYYKWLAAGSPEGREQEFWFAAEKEIGEMFARPQPKPLLQPEEILHNLNNMQKRIADLLRGERGVAGTGLSAGRVTIYLEEDAPHIRERIENQVMCLIGDPVELNFLYTGPDSVLTQAARAAMAADGYDWEDPDEYLER